MFKSKGQAVLGLIVGLGLVAYGIYSWFDSQNFFKTAEQTTAVVSSINRDYENDGDEKNDIYYDYTVDGKVYTESENKSGSTSLSEGDEFIIYYDPANPSDGRFENETKMFPLASIGLGAVVLIMALVSLFKKSKS